MLRGEKGGSFELQPGRFGEHRTAGQQRRLERGEARGFARLPRLGGVLRLASGRVELAANGGELLRRPAEEAARQCVSRVDSGL
jgi:hypothetical protein